MIKFIKQFSKLQHIIYVYCVYIDLDSWKNVLPRMYIDLYIVNRNEIVVIYCHGCWHNKLGVETYILLH